MSGPPTRPRLPRRRFLTLAAGAGALACGGGVTAALGLRGCASDPGGLRWLDAHQYRTVGALAEALIPEGGAFPVGARGADLARVFDGYIADEPAWIRDEVSDALLLIEYGPIADGDAVATFSRLDAGARLALFRRWSDGDDPTRRQVAFALRRFVALAFYQRPATWPHLGYDGLIPGSA